MYFYFILLLLPFLFLYYHFEIIFFKLMFFLSYLEIKFILFFKKNDKFALFYKNNDKKKFKIIKLEIDEKLSKKNLNLIHKFKIIKIYYSYQNINYKIIIKNNSELNNFKNFMYREDFKVKKSNILSAYYLDSDITDNINCDITDNELDKLIEYILLL